MNMNLADFDRSPARKYLQHIENLTAEIKVGMDAVGSNALSSFEQSLSRQQAICASLCRLNGQMNIEQAMLSQESAGAGSTPVVDYMLAERIRLAAESLQALNQRYAALLRHSRETIRLFSGLCGSYTGQFQQPVVMSASRAKWSCES